MVLVIVNNQWAISAPRSKQNTAKTLAQKGIAGGLPSIQVDGNVSFENIPATLLRLFSGKNFGKQLLRL